MPRRNITPLSVLRRIFGSMETRFEPDAVFAKCVEILSEALGSGRCLIYQRDAEGHLHVTHEYARPEVMPYGIGNAALTPSAYLAHQTLATVSVDDVAEDPRFQATMDRQLFTEMGVKSALCTPILAGGVELGLVETHMCKRARQWTEAEIELLETVADQVAIIAHSSRLLADQKKLAHCLATMNQDLSWLYVELATKDEQIDRFMHLISHDLRAPVVAIEGLVNLLKQSYENEAPDSKPRRYLELILKSAEQITGLTGALLEYAKLGQMSIQLADVDTGEMVREIWQRLALSESNIDLEIFSPLPVVRADRAMLARIFQNLFENAIKYRKPVDRAVIDITCAETSDHWQFAVNDDGIGFHPGEADQLFDIFTRLKQARSRPGSGIGLASVLELSKLHGGTAWAAGRPGKGATFYFTIAKSIPERSVPRAAAAVSRTSG